MLTGLALEELGGHVVADFLEVLVPGLEFGEPRELVLVFGALKDPMLLEFLDLGHIGPPNAIQIGHLLPQPPHHPRRKPPPLLDDPPLILNHNHRFFGPAQHRFLLI